MTNRPSNTDLPVVVFDLDGTLTTKDSFLAYLLTFGTQNGKYGAFAKMPFRLASYFAKLVPDYRLKQALIRDFLSSCSLEVVKRHTDWFCSNWLPQNMHPIGRQLLEAHRQQGHRLILLSASPNIFVPTIAKSLGIDEVVCTEIQVAEDRWTGDIVGKNCKGEQKLTAIQAYLGLSSRPNNSFGYGDSSSDRHILQWVQHGAWIRRNCIVPLPGSSPLHFPSITVL